MSIHVEPGFTGEAHPELFNLKAMPPFSKERKDGQLPENMIRQYFENGYVVVKDFFKPEELDPCKESIMSMVDDLAHTLYKAGKIQNLYEDYGFYERLSMIDKEFPGSNILFIKQAVMTQVARGGHKLGLVATHTCCYGGTWYIMLEEEQMAKDLDIDLEKDLITCPVPYGGMVLFNNMIPHRSLPNNSNKIRWTVDLRWQTPHHPYGFYGLKQGVVFRNSENNSHKISWEEEEKVNRHQISIDVMKEADDEDPIFDTTVKGPWMRKWEIVHHNTHTQHLQK